MLFSVLLSEIIAVICVISSIACLQIASCCLNVLAAEVLEGKIEHAGSLPPVSGFKAGAKFDASKLPAPGEQSLIWWRVPHWLVGTWKNAGKIKRIAFKDLTNPEAKEEFNSVDVNYPDSEVIGYQKDRLGSIWTCVPLPYVGRSEQKRQLNISIVHSAHALEVSEKEVVIRFLATTLVVDKAKKRIVSVIQRESLQTYRPIDPGRVLVQASMQFYDAEGNARYETKVLGQTHLEESFHETPYLHVPAKQPTLIDLRMSFDKFLKDRNMDELRPLREPLMPVPGYKMIVL